MRCLTLNKEPQLFTPKIRIARCTTPNDLNEVVVTLEEADEVSTTDLNGSPNVEIELIVSTIVGRILADIPMTMMIMTSKVLHPITIMVPRTPPLLPIHLLMLIQVKAKVVVRPTNRAANISSKAELLIQRSLVEPVTPCPQAINHEVMHTQVSPQHQIFTLFYNIVKPRDAHVCCK